MSDPEALYTKLRPGPGKSSAEVASHQRVRIHGAMIEVAGEHGYGAVTVRALTRAAGVSSRTFYEHFDGKEECFLETYDLVIRRLARRMTTTQRKAGDEWRQRLRVGIETLVWTLAGELKTARLCLVEIFAVGHPGLERLRHASATLDAVIRAGLEGTPGEEAVPPLLVKGIVGGAMEVIRAALITGREHELPALADGIVDWALSCSGGSLSCPAACEAAGLAGECEAGEAGADELGDERGQILIAAARLAAGEGYEELTLPRIRAAAGVTTKTFKRHFDDVEECFLAAAETLLSRLMAESLRQGAPGRSWAGRVFRSVSTLCERVAREPDLARVALLGPVGAGPQGLRRRERLIELGAEWLRRSAPPRCRPGRLDAEASLGGVWGLINHRIFSGRTAEMPRHAGTLSFLILAPAVGSPRASEAIHDEVALAP